MRKLTVWFLGFICAIAVDAHEPWNFVYLKSPSYQLVPTVTLVYPEFREFLESIHSLVEEGEYETVSRLLRVEINSLDITTRNPAEFEKLFALMSIDAAIDYFLRQERRQGSNKQYMVSYLLTRRLFEREKSGSRYGITSDLLKEHPYLVPVLVMYGPSMITLHNGSRLSDSFSLFVRFVENLPVFSFSLLHEEVDIPDAYRDLLFADEEVECFIAEYWYEDDETSYFYVPTYTLDMVFDSVSSDLFFMSDFSEDIRIFSSPVMQWIAQEAVNLTDPNIPVLEKIASRDDLLSQRLLVCVHLEKHVLKCFLTVIIDNARRLALAQKCLTITAGGARHHRR